MTSKAKALTDLSELLSPSAAFMNTVNLEAKAVFVCNYQEKGGARKMLGAVQGIWGGRVKFHLHLVSPGWFSHVGPRQSSEEEASKRLHVGKTELKTLKTGKQM